MLRRLRASIGFAAAVALGGGFYLLLIDTTSLPELYVLAGVTLACAIGFQLAREQGFVEARIAPSWLGRSWRLVLRIPSDIVIVCSEAVAQLLHPRPTRGVFRATEFTATSQTPSDSGRRALAESMGSLAPNTIVVGVDAERHLLLTHQLRRHGPADDLDVTRLG